ncbi:MAG: carbamoyltransferase HypF [Bacteroidetes bacterium]|nr:MAG: carbamoyltransferase HypF [Bacteroidota bacterium]
MTTAAPISSAFSSADLPCSEAMHWHIHLQGRVQGVGFRPYVYNLAVQWQLKGVVSNGLDGLHILLQATGAAAKAFYETLISQPPDLAIITHCQLKNVPPHSFDDFSIQTDVVANQTPNLWITPDLATCSTCVTEMNHPRNRRYRYAFTTCTQCGPRYSIMQALPFERHFTTMQPFEFCAACAKEFTNPADRRFYAQTMSCATCGVSIQWHDNSGAELNVKPEQIIDAAAEAILLGQIVAVKGIGGYLLLADTANKGAIQRLRQKKQRPGKPLAVLYPSLDALQHHTTVTPCEAEMLTSPQAPIVLLPIAPAMHTALATGELAPALDKIGVMLPYAPLLHLIALACNRPLVATSGNISGAPICFTEAEALMHLSPIADYFLTHNRPIVAPQDDSLVSIPALYNQPILLRRSRGYAPACPTYQPQQPKSIVATGALIKSSFAISHAQQVYVSQYLGNTDSYEAQQSYRHTYNHLASMLQMQPQVVVADMHPGYFAHAFAHELAAANGLQVHTVQHHKAHFAAVLAENNLLEHAAPVLGVIWDGIGMGDDGQSWGGEFFTFEKGQMRRCYYFDYFAHLLGDKMAREPRLAALAALQDAWPQVPLPQGMFTTTEEDLYRRMLDSYNGIKTSSVGRLFDAVAALVLGISHQSYEGEAAMRLEATARQWLGKNALANKDSYFSSGAHYHRIPTASLMQAIALDASRGKELGYMAAKFHRSLVHVVDIIAGHLQVQDIACSGGVFQNALLVDMMVHYLGSKYKLYFHKHLPPNDENIAFGQLVWVDRIEGAGG